MGRVKEIYVPFDERGNMQSYGMYSLDDIKKNMTKEGVEGGYLIKREWQSGFKDVERWLLKGCEELTLEYEEYGRGCSSTTFYWRDSEGHRYPMFVSCLSEMLEKGVLNNKVHGMFAYVKRGQNYSIKWVGECE